MGDIKITYIKYIILDFNDYDFTTTARPAPTDDYSEEDRKWKEENCKMFCDEEELECVTEEMICDGNVFCLNRKDEQNCHGMYLRVKMYKIVNLNCKIEL